MMMYIPEIGTVSVPPRPSENHVINPKAWQKVETEVPAGKRLEKTTRQVKGKTVDDHKEVAVKATKTRFELIGEPWVYDESLHWKNITRKRDILLEESDKIGNRPDHPKNTPKFKAYCKALRELKDGVDKPTDVVWPTKPEGV